MKNKVAIATLAALPMAFTSVHASGQIGVVTASSLNIRSGPGISNKINFVAKKNDKLTILSSSNGWYKVKSDSGKEGWGSSKYISISSQTTTSNSSSNGNKQVTASRLNMRNGAGMSYRVICVLNKGDKVELISKSNEWSKIKHNGRIGYVANQYLGDIKTSEGTTNTGTVNTTKKQVNASSLNVRSGEGTSCGVIGSLKRGAIIDVISQNAGWSKINYNGKIGYVSSIYLKEVAQNNTNNNQNNNTNNNQNNTNNNTNNNQNNNTNIIKKQVNTASLNVRSGPGTGYSKLGALTRGKVVDVLSENGGWSRIKYNGKDCYVSSGYLIDPSSQAPSNSQGNNTNNNNTNNNNTNNNSSNETQVGGSETVNGFNVNYKPLDYTLDDHINKQYEKAVSGGNIIASSNSRSSSALNILGESLTTFSIRGSSPYVCASKTDLERYLNPNNFTSSTSGIMQFLRTDSYREGISVESLNSYLNSLPSTSGTNVFYNQGQAFINAARKYNIDLTYLVANAMWETGYGRSVLAQGQTITSYKGQELPNPVKVYNFYGIGAIDRSANVSGAEAAYSNGWTSVEATIDGSAKWISQNYIHNSKYNQNTVYKMRWNYDYTWHQYASDVNWANGISNIMSKIASKCGASSNVTFEVPKYR